MSPVEWVLLGGSSLFLWFWVSCDTKHYDLKEENNKDFLSEFEND